MVPVEVLDQHHDMQAQSEDDGVDLSIVFEVSLLSRKRKRKRTRRQREQRERRASGGDEVLACRRVERKSIIFCTARVPCMFSEMFTRSCATDSQITFRCSSVEYSSSFWQR